MKSFGVYVFKRHGIIAQVVLKKEHPDRELLGTRWSTKTESCSAQGGAPRQSCSAQGGAPRQSCSAQGGAPRQRVAQHKVEHQDRELLGTRWSILTESCSAQGGAPRQRVAQYKVVPCCGCGYVGGCCCSDDV